MTDVRHIVKTSCREGCRALSLHELRQPDNHHPSLSSVCTYCTDGTSRTLGSHSTCGYRTCSLGHLNSISNISYLLSLHLVAEHMCGCQWQHMRYWTPPPQVSVCSAVLSYCVRLCKFQRTLEYYYIAPFTKMAIDCLLYCNTARLGGCFPISFTSQRWWE